MIKLIAITALVLASACATVPPYERETLARRDMALERNPDASAGEHHATATAKLERRGRYERGGCGCH